MTLGLKDMIARCIARMRAKECARCDNRAVCPAGRWQQWADRNAEPEREIRGRFQSFFDELVGAIERGGSRRSGFSRDVEAALKPLLDSGEANIDRVAHELGISRQTLYRRLKDEGTTFEEILDRLRHRLALRYLRQDKLSVKTASYRLGFSDPAAFSRAFKRWTGSSPRAAIAA